MWICPKCNREFKNVNQDHYCGDAPQTIGDYIAAQPEAVQPFLTAVRAALKEALPGASERISWRMPTFWDNRNIIHFAAFGNHMGLYPGDKAVAHFQKRLEGYKTSKGTVQFKYGEPLPLDLITEIAKWCHGAENHKGV